MESNLESQSKPNSLYMVCRQEHFISLVYSQSILTETDQNLVSSSSILALLRHKQKHQLDYQLRYLRWLFRGMIH